MHGVQVPLNQEGGEFTKQTKTYTSPAAVASDAVTWDKDHEWKEVRKRACWLNRRVLHSPVCSRAKFP